MPSVDDTPLSEELVPRNDKTESGKWLDLHTYWESWYGGKANVTISISEEVDGEFLEDVELFYEEIPEWADGEFTNQDVIERFGSVFWKLLEKERRKVYPLRKWPRPGQRGPGRGWHGEPERHRQAALKGKFASVRDAETAINRRIAKELGLPAPRSMRWIGQSAVMGAAKKIGKKKDMGVSFK